MKPTVIHQHITNVPQPVLDKMTIGTPSSGGALEVHFHANNPVEAKTLIDNAVSLLKYAKMQRDAL